MGEFYQDGYGGGVNGVEEQFGPHDFCTRLEKEFTPFVGQEFDDLETGIKFYKIYALACGFTSRRWSTSRWRDGTLQFKLAVCNREGFWESKKQRKAKAEGCVGGGRKNKLQRIGCRARIRFFVKNGVIRVDVFNEFHNHELVSPEHRQFQKMARHLTKYHKRLILANSRLNIGATKTYRMYKELVDGFENVGATLNDFKNFKRDVNCFIHDRDGQLFVDHLLNLKETRPGFYFDYDVDNKGRLRRIIWADDYARKSYAIFGDGLAFDPTYSTNKYSMVFTPFTGVDNHRKSITFGGALIATEDYESFVWVFTRFLFAMEGKEPSYIITDQDPGIIKAVKEVFKIARHRFCMWHIMNKVPSKFGVSRPDYQEFLKKLNGIIWDREITGDDFDAQWDEIMVNHGVGAADWFKETFEIRRQWVMAHCKDIKMGAIMRTTQRSESENNFFKRFECKNGTLVEFWMRFESAMEQQRHNHRGLDNVNSHSMPQLLGCFDIEKDAARIFTHVIFEEFQEELRYSMSSCICKGYREDGSYEVTLVRDSVRDRVFEVRYNYDTNDAQCSCGLYDHNGIICRHVLWILSCHGLKKIPEGMVARRWRKNALKSLEESVLVGSNEEDGKFVEMSKLWEEFQETLGVVRGLDGDKIMKLTTLIREFREAHCCAVIVPLSKDAEIEELLGVKSSSVVSILPPKQSKNKGSGKRMLSNKTKAVEIAKKPKRLCNNYKEMAHHDKRNCPNPFVESRDDVVESGC